MRRRAASKRLLAAALMAVGAGASAQPATSPTAWSNAPLSPGRWVYGGGPASSASYAGQFTIRCLGPGRIALERSGTVTGIALTVRTTSVERAVSGRRGTTNMVAELSAGDPLLDAMAFSRGRFAVEAAGVPRLIVPAWPELGRVVEDCRRGQ